MNNNRVKVDDKRIINCRADLNQLVPFKYKWAWQKYLDACANHWMPNEIPMLHDIATWKGDTLTANERLIIERSLGFFSTADSLVANNLVFAIYRHITNPECRQYLLRQAFEEALHTHAYQYIIESLGMDESRIFNMYHEDETIAVKAEWALGFTNSLTDSTWNTSTAEGIQRLVRDLIAYYVVVEGVFFYTGFTLTLSLGRRGLMKATAEQFQYILRDESMHLNFGIDVVNTIIEENPEIWTDRFKREIIDMIKEGVELELQYARYTIANGAIGLNIDMFRDFLYFIANRRFEQLGLHPDYLYVSDPFPWMSEIMDLNKEKNFFESRVTEYQTGGTLSWDD